MVNTKFHKENLDFMTEFLLETGLSISQFAERCGRTRQDISYLIRQDDIMLSSATEFFTKNGYKLVFSYNAAATDTQHPTVITMDIADVDYSATTKCRLYFLKKQMRRYGLSGKEVADQINVPQHFMKYAFIIDDMRISKLKEIAAAYNWTLKVDIVKV